MFSKFNFKYFPREDGKERIVVFIFSLEMKWSELKTSPNCISWLVFGNFVLSNQTEIAED